MGTDLRVATSDGICRITLTREAALNAFSPEMAVGLVEALRSAVADDPRRR